jgi:hypothetical protein
MTNFHIDEDGKHIVTASGKIVSSTPDPMLLDILNRRSTGGEWRTVRRLLNFLKRNGFAVVGVWDGEETEHPASVLETLAFVFNLDEVSIRISNDGGKTEHGILIVLGNNDDGSEVVSDWSFSNNDPDGFDALMDRFLSTLP